MGGFIETYRGCEIKIENETDLKLTINGKQIDYEHNSTVNRWSSRYLPYSDYDTLLNLARAIIRDTEEFSTDS